MSARRTLILTQSFPPDAGGEAAYLYQFCQRLEGDLTVVSYRAKRTRAAARAAHARLGRFHVIRVPYLFYLSWITRALTLLAVSAIGCVARPSVTICNGPGVAFAARFLKKVFGIGYILIAHGRDVAAARGSRRGLSRALGSARFIVANSRFTRAEVLKRCPSADVRVIPPMIDEEILAQPPDPTLRETLGLADKKVILTVSELSLFSGHKGHDLVLMALPEVAARHPNAVYVVVGEGDLRPRLEKLAVRLGVRERVMFLDYDRARLRAYYELCDVFVMPSRVNRRTGAVEGFGIVYLEAAVWGKPCVGGRSGGVGDAIADGRTGLLVDPLNSFEIRDAILRLLDDPPLARTLGQEARLRATEEFSPERIQPEISALVRAFR